MTDESFLRQAIRLAEEHSADGTNGPFGAVVVQDGAVVGEGWNRVVSASDPTAHAEIIAIREACRTLGTYVLDDCAIYCSCEPCPMCLAAIYWARIPRVLYAASAQDAAEAGFDDARIGDELARPAAERTVKSSQVLRQEGVEVLRAWAGNPRKRPY